MHPGDKDGHVNGDHGDGSSANSVSFFCLLWVFTFLALLFHIGSDLVGNANVDILDGMLLPAEHDQAGDIDRAVDLSSASSPVQSRAAAGAAIAHSSAGVGSSWLNDVFAAVPTKHDLLVHAPFFWKELAALADVKIGNWNKDTKGFKKSDPATLWQPVVDLEAARAKNSSSGSKKGRTVIVFVKCSLCTLLSADRSAVKGPYIIMGTFNDNWGMLADAKEGVIHQTQSIVQMRDPRCAGTSGGRTMADLEAFIGDRRLQLWVVNHHVFRPDLDKVITMPLGLKERDLWDVGRGILDASIAAAAAGRAPAKVRLLELNNNAWRFREALNSAVNASFGHALVNSYSLAFKEKDAKLPGNNRCAIMKAYLLRLASSTFVLCPPGLGMDSYRVYEALLMGAVAVVEWSPGLDRALAHLPVLFVRDLAARLTPALLEHVAALLSSPAQTMPWRFERLTHRFWVGLVGAAASAEGRVDDGWDAHATDECACWFPAGTCVDFAACRIDSRFPHAGNSN